MSSAETRLRTSVSLSSGFRALVSSALNSAPKSSAEMVARNPFNCLSCPSVAVRCVCKRARNSSLLLPRNPAVVPRSFCVSWTRELIRVDNSARVTMRFISCECRQLLQTPAVPKVMAAINGTSRAMINRVRIFMVSAPRHGRRFPRGMEERLGLSQLPREYPTSSLKRPVPIGTLRETTIPHGEDRCNLRRTIVQEWRKSARIPTFS